GGAGPLFATLLARELEIPRIVVPRFAGNFSAWGLLCQDVARSAALTSGAALDDRGLDRTWHVLEQLFAKLDADRGDSRVHGEEVCEAELDLRYSGQGYTLTVPIAWTEARGERADPAAVEAGFKSSYERTFGHTMDEEVEIFAARASVRTLLPPLALDGDESAGCDRGEVRSIEAYSFT